MLRRLQCYADRVFGLRPALDAVRARRKKPRIPTGLVLASYVLLFWANLGSLNALEQGRADPAWRRWLGGELCSADTMGRVAALLDPDDLRDLLRRHHRRRKRNKGFARRPGQLRYLVLDGHEGVHSYKRSWKDALERVVHFATADRARYYFRYVAAYLTNGREWILLDAEPQRSGEGEIEAARRLVQRLLKHEARAFDVVSGDALYLDPALWKLVRRHKKHLLAVLKNENRDLLQDARSLFALSPGARLDRGKTQRTCWDLEGFTTWPQAGETVRVVRSLEQTPVKRQRDKRIEMECAEWFWATSLPQALASTRTVVEAGHGRWDIENHGFNELCTRWHADHAYKYDANALLNGVLLLFLAFNVWNAFYTRNLKPQARAGHTQTHWRQLVGADFRLAFAPAAPPHPP